MPEFWPLLFGYLLGSIPFGLLLTKAAGLGDIRAIGSGNIGATNVLRTGHKGLALLTLLLDGGKGTVAVWAAPHLSPDITAPALAGLAAFFGHLFPLWLKGKGGKGVATGFGVLLGLAWPVGLIALGLWLLTAKLSCYSSLSALTAFTLTPLIAFLGFADTRIAVVSVGMLPFIWWKHRANVARLRRGEEPKIGQG
jgi:glycerol-3-phosphate acyltransferase PlsY